MLDELEKEPLSVGKIDIQEFHQANTEGRDIFAERVEKRINEILERYKCALVVTEFTWVNGVGVSGKFGVVRQHS
jgi:hypothetical protein